MCGGQVEAQGKVIQLGSEVGHYAQRFYDALYQLDACNLSRIWVEWPPERPEWLAIRNRLVRAITPVEGQV